MSVTFYALQKLRASDLQALVDDHLRVAKPGDTPRVSNATLTEDPHLLLDLEADYTYIIRWVIYSTSPTAADIQFAISFPAGATTPFGGIRLISTASPTGDVDVGAYDSATSGTSAIGAAGTTGVQTTTLEATVIMGSTAGAVTLLWAQLVSNVGMTTVHEGSSMIATRIR